MPIEGINTLKWSQALVDWFIKNQRDMPWRSHPSPYHTLISEMMLQQTQVNTVIPYFNRFIERFPTIHHLAHAPIDDVLKLWEGLGYYSRARNLHKTASIISQNFSGEIPSDHDQLLDLPGIGPYIAAAVSSIAFEKKHPVIDGNVFRVFTRFWEIDSDIASSKTRHLLLQNLQPAIEQHKASDFNQAIMELGALICKPSDPDCTSCPLQNNCQAFSHQSIHKYPVKTKKKPTPHHQIGVGIIIAKDQVLIGRRPENKMLGGLWEFPGGKQENNESIETTVIRELQEETGVNVQSPVFFKKINHAYSHFKITLHAFIIEVNKQPSIDPSYVHKWVPVSELNQFAFPKANKVIVDELISTYQK